jgi:hypothetical protein
MLTKSTSQMNSKKSVFSNSIILVFALSWLYWAYLGTSSTMVIKYDAIEYQALGKIIYQEGLLVFFKTGERYNVIFYPLLIALSHWLADYLPFVQLKILTFLQLIILALTQLLVFKTLQRLQIRRTVTACVLLYFGFSPSLVNTALSSWPEIMTYPLVFGVVYAGLKAWGKIVQGKERLLRVAIIFALAFWAATMVREIYEYVILLFGLTFLIASFRSTKLVLRTVLFFVITLTSYQLLLLPYKSLNYQYQGYKSLTYKGGISFYGLAVSRSEPITGQEFMQFLAFIPGEQVIKNVYGQQAFEH